MAKTTKILLVILIIIIVAGVLIVILINRPFGAAAGTAADTTVIINKSTGEETAEITGEETLSRQEQYESLLENKDFIEVYNNFRYLQSEITDAGLVEDNGTLFYMVFGSADSFDKIDQFYKNKKVQSVWSRTEIFEAVDEKLEEGFIEDEEEVSGENGNDDFRFSKYSFISQDKDRYLNVLVKSMSDKSTQIMLISWNLDS